MSLIDSLPTPLRRLINEAALWCLPRLDATRMANCWRSEELRPKYFEPSRAATVASLIRDRRNRLGTVLTPKAGAGRLLAYFPDAELSDGAAELESHGFFDVYNEPPWDSWIAWTVNPVVQDSAYREFLTVWIPDILVPMAQRSINVNPEQSIEWLEELPQSYRDAFIAGGNREG
jgi:hypothetical protein